MRGSLKTKITIHTITLLLLISGVAFTYIYHLNFNALYDRELESNSIIAMAAANGLYSELISELGDSVVKAYQEAESKGLLPDKDTLDNAQGDIFAEGYYEDAGYSDEYFAVFDDVINSPAYQATIEDMIQISDSLYSNGLFIMYPLPDSKNAICICNSNGNDSYFRTGTLFPVDFKTDANYYYQGIVYTPHDMPLPEHGIIIASGQGIFDRDDNLKAFAYSYMLLDSRLDMLRKEMLHSSVYIILIILIIGISSYFVLNKVIVEPINRLSAATRNFAAGGTELGHIPDLNIRSKDEIGNLYESVKTLEVDIKKYVNELSTMTAEKNRISTELSVASRIQESMLPDGTASFTGHSEFRISASMTPAKEVGGDYYDFFMPDDKHLVIVIGDVSDKGVPACLYMVRVLSAVKEHVGAKRPLNEIVSRINTTLCDRNDQAQFLTMWIASINIETGEISSVNAGHEYTAFSRAGTPFDFIRSKHDKIVGVVENATYNEKHDRLMPGDRIFVYTDGIIDATNAEEKQFGRRHLTEVLNSRPDASPAELVEIVKRNVEEFSGDAPQFDDITMVAFEYLGKKDQ